MPTPPSVSKVVRIDMAHSWDGDPHLANRSFWTYTGSDPTVPNMNDLAGFFEGFWASYLAPLASSTIHLIEIVATDLTSPTASRGIWTGSTAGSRSGFPMSINDCVVLNFGISRRYRGGKPRIYGPWGCIADLDTSQIWGSSFVSAVESGWTSLHGSAVGQGFGSCAITSQVNVSLYEGFVAAENPVTKRYRNIPTYRDTAVTDTIDTFVCSPFVGSQRRRVRA